MNKVAVDILSHYGEAELLGYTPVNPEEDALHYGMKRRSGRYPWGSGDNPYQRSGDFISRVEALKEQGLSKSEIIDLMNKENDLKMTPTDYDIYIRIAKHDREDLLRDRIRSLREDGLTDTEIAKQLGLKGESTVRSKMSQEVVNHRSQAQNVAEVLKQQLEENNMIDIGKGSGARLGVTDGVLREAVYILEGQGYLSYGVGQAQVSDISKGQTTTAVLANPGFDTKYAKAHMDEIATVLGNDIYSPDDGKTFYKTERPANVDPDRVMIRYPEDGGGGKDGVIELRRGVEDLDLGGSHYSQARILVDNDHYLKGMAVYGKDSDFPPGVDIIFNTSKSSDTPKIGPDKDHTVLKPIGDDPNNPFGSNIEAAGQYHYISANGETKLGAINKLRDEGKVDEWSRTLATQFLSKQPLKLINHQLDITYEGYEEQMKDIMSVKNPTLRKKMLMDFADQCDTDAVHLKAAAFPRQSTKVILPCDDIPDDKVFAPSYENGEKLALIRYPHTSIREIPILTVDNNNKTALDIYSKDLKDAIAINANVAARMSGADFDGDTVVCIPTGGANGIKINSKPQYDKLIGFEPKYEYAGTETSKRMKKSQTNREMGIISNLITDMEIKRATDDEMVRAIKHSMVVIDAEKHGLDYQRSYKENGIAELKSIYQKHKDDDGYGGASTLISMVSASRHVPQRAPFRESDIDPETGEIKTRLTGKTITKMVGKDANGKPIYQKTDQLKTEEIPAGKLYSNLHDLSTGTPKEEAYANFGNKLKAMGNLARKLYLSTEDTPYSPEANAKYKKEWDQVTAQLQAINKAKPLERRAQRLAGAQIESIRRSSTTELSWKETKALYKKYGTRYLNEARTEVGKPRGKDLQIHLTDRQKEAIDAGAFRKTTVKQIFQHCDPKELREWAIPSSGVQLSASKQAHIKALSASGYSPFEIANMLQISSSTVEKYTS